MVVMKFGGTSVADQAAIERLMAIVSRQRQKDVAAGADKQFLLEVALQRLDVLANAGLAHVQPARGLAEVEFLGDGDEVAQLADVHAYRELE